MIIHVLYTEARQHEYICNVPNDAITLLCRTHTHTLTLIETECLFVCALCRLKSPFAWPATIHNTHSRIKIDMVALTNINLVNEIIFVSLRCAKKLLQMQYYTIFWSLECNKFTHFELFFISSMSICLKCLLKIK